MAGQKSVAVAGAVGRAAPWIVSAAALAWIAPRLLNGALSLLHTRTEPADVVSPAPSVLLVSGIVMCTAALLTALLRSGEHRSSFGWACAPSLALVIGIQCAVAGLGAMPIHDLILEPRSWAPGGVLLLMVALCADALRRRDLPVEQLTIRISVAASVMWFCGVATTHAPTFWQPWDFLVENAACSSAEAGTFRVIATVTASLCVLSALASRITRRRHGHLLPLGGLAAWFASRAIVDVVSHRVAHGVCAESITTSSVSMLAAAADYASGVGLAICMGCFGIAAARETLGTSSPMRSWSVFALVPTLLLFTSPTLEPTFGSSRSAQLTWAGAPPRYAAQLQMTAVLNSDGELHVFHAGRQTHPASVDRIAPPHGQTDGIAVFVQDGATFRDLRDAASALRAFDEIGLVWRQRDLYTASDASRRRWPFIETESKALRGRVLHIRDVRACSLYRHARELRPHCRDIHGNQVGVSLVEEPDDLFVTEWLRRDAVPNPNDTLMVFDRDTEPEWHPTVGALESEPVPTIISTDAKAGLVGLLIALFAALGFIARELRIAQRLGASAHPVETGTPSTKTHPTWVAPELATLNVKSTKATPYRGGPQDQMQLATLPTSMRELKKAAAKALHQTSEATMRWVFLAVVATALGFVLPLLFAF